MRLFRLETQTLRLVCAAPALVLGVSIGHARAQALSARLENAAAVLNHFLDISGAAPNAKVAAGADCVAVFPGFYKGAAVSGVFLGPNPVFEVSFGKGFLSCRNGVTWSAPGAMTIEARTLEVQIGQKADLVIVSVDKGRRRELLANRFTFGADDSAGQRGILVLSATKGVFTAFQADGATLEPDDSTNLALYGKPLPLHEIVRKDVAIPVAAQPFVSLLGLLFPRANPGH